MYLKVLLVVISIKRNAATNFAPPSPAVPLSQCQQSIGNSVRLTRSVNLTANCDIVISHFNKKWRTHAKSKEYLTTFSSSSWGQLSLGQQAEHSLSSCSACAKKYGELQLAYPGLPYYSAPSTLVQLPQEGESVKEVTRMVLGELNQSYCEAFGQGFTEAAVRYCGKAEGI